RRARTAPPQIEPPIQTVSAPPEPDPVEPPPVEVAAAVSEAEFQARVDAAVESGWRAEEHHLDTGEHSIHLESEMQRHYAAQAAPEPPVEAPASAVPAEV